MNLLLMIFFSVSSWGKTNFLAEEAVLIRSSTVNHEQYDSFMQNHPEYMNVKNYWLKTLEKDFSQIEITYKKALNEFFRGSFTESQRLFKVIIEKTYTSDWNLNSRKIINYSCFRLAQMEDNKFKEWIQMAYNFDNSIPPDSKNFPPPFQEMWSNLELENANSKNLNLWSPNLGIGQFDYIFVNGREFNYYHFTPIELSPQKNRITLIGNNGSIKTLTGTPEVIKSHRWTSQSLAQGNCSQPRISSTEFLGKNFFILFDNNCIINSKPERLLDLKPLSELNSEPLNKNKISSLKFPDPTLEKKGGFLNSKSRPWIWLGIAVGGFILHEQIRRSQSSSDINVHINPTHKKGF